MSKHAIYMIICLANDKVYVGSAVDVSSRLRTHKSKLNLNKHPNKHLQAAYNLYGVDSFDFRILEVVTNKNQLLAKEDFWIDWLKASDRELGFNKRVKANSNLGIKKPHSPETIIKIGLGNKGKKQPLEAIEQTRKKLTGRKLTDQHKANALEGRRLKSGFAQSDSNKIKIGLANSKPELWPHPDKSFCECRECLDKKNKQRKIRTKAKAEKRKTDTITKILENGTWIESLKDKSLQ